MCLVFIWLTFKILHFFHSCIFPCLPSTFFWFVLFWMRLAGWCLDPLHIFLCMFSFWHNYFYRKYWKDSWKMSFWGKRGKWKSGKLTILLFLRARKGLNRRFANILFDAKLSVFCNVWNPAFLLESFQLKQLSMVYITYFLSTLAAGQSSHPWVLQHDFHLLSHQWLSVTDISPAELSGDYWEWSQPSFSSRIGTAFSALPDKLSVTPADRAWLAPLPVIIVEQWGKAFVPAHHLSMDKCRIGALHGHTCQVSSIMDMDFKLE